MRQNSRPAFVYAKNPIYDTESALFSAICLSAQASDFSSRVFTTPHMTTVKGTCHITTCELQRVAVCPCVAVWCSVLQRVAACCSVSTLRLKRVTLVNTVRESVAVCCSVLQCVAVCCSVSTLRVKRGTLINTVHESVAVVCSVLQCVTVCYSALQCVAVCPRCVWNESLSWTPMTFVWGTT